MDYPKRKHPRLKNYDYSQNGYYYITIHLHQSRKERLSIVGRGLAPAVASITLTQAGKIAQQQLVALEQRYPYVKLDKYVIMPNHIHAIIALHGDETGVLRQGIPEILCAYKSLTTRLCNQALQTPGGKLFQDSFYETVLRNEAAYRECWRYIEENPAKWLLNLEDRRK